MKLLIAGSDEVWSLERYYIRHLQNAGVDVKICPVQSIFFAWYNKSILNKVLFKAGLSNIYSQIGNTLKKTIEDWQPDALWVFKGMEISVDVLEWIKKRNIRVVNYNPDNPFIFSGSGSGNKNVSNSIGLYDLHFTYDREIRDQIIREYNVPTRILPFAYEISDELYEACTKQQEVVKVCFLGNPDANRAAFILKLAEHIPVDVYGNNWNQFVSHKNITVFEPVYKNDFWKMLFKYRVQLNLMRVHNPNSHNMRSFEVPGIGGIGLFPYTADHAEYFDEGKEVFLYRDVEECIKWCNVLLNMSAEEAKNIRLAARKKSVEAGYSYRDKALQALQEIKKLLA
jgi:spore maturation protein CgeB